MAANCKNLQVTNFKGTMFFKYTCCSVVIIFAPLNDSLIGVTHFKVLQCYGLKELSKAYTYENHVIQ